MPYLARTHQLKSSLLYHIFGRGNERKEIFLDAEDYHYFINLLIEYSKKHNFYIYHWVFVPNQYYLLLAFNSEEEGRFENLESPQGSGEFLKRLMRDKGLLLLKRRGSVRN